MKREQVRLYAITDRFWLHGNTLAMQVEQAILGGATMIQLREKKLKGEELECIAREVQAICKQNHIPFIINDDVQLAKKIDADGVHVGQEDMEALQVRQMLGKDKIVGVTAKTVLQAQAAQLAGADYLGSGAVFGSSTKTDAKYMTRERLIEICKAVTIPVVAIGGIDASNIDELRKTGISGVAVVSGIFAQKNIAQAAHVLREKADGIVNDSFADNKGI